MEYEVIPMSLWIAKHLMDLIFNQKNQKAVSCFHLYSLENFTMKYPYPCKGLNSIAEISAHLDYF